MSTCSTEHRAAVLENNDKLINSRLRHGAETRVIRMRTAFVVGLACDCKTSLNEVGVLIGVDKSVASSEACDDGWCKENQNEEAKKGQQMIQD